MRLIKIDLIVLLILTAVFSACSKYQYESAASFLTEPSAKGNAVVITKYEGRDIVNVRVPPRINNKSVTEISQNAFGDLELLSITIPGTITKIGDWSFSGNFIPKFVIPKKVTEIGAGAFMYNRLTHITIPNSVKKIGYRAFCQNPLTSITIGSNVELEALSGHDIILDEDWVYYAFEMGLELEFDDYYRKNGSKAGTYVLKDGAWHYRDK